MRTKQPRERQKKLEEFVKELLKRGYPVGQIVRMVNEVEKELS